MNSLRIQALRLISLGILALALSSCRPTKQADALMTEEGIVAGVIIEYRSPIDKASLASDTYTIPGRDIATYFVSNSNPFKKEKDEKNRLGEEGRYVVLLLKAGENKPDPNEPINLVTGNKPPKVEVRVKQVAPVTTSSGRVIKPWDKSLKPTDYYLVNGGLSR